MNKLELFVQLMESFPTSIAQPDQGFMPEDIMALAAEIRDKAGMPRPETPETPGMGAISPDALDYKYTGHCNGCGAPIFLPGDYYRSKN